MDNRIFDVNGKIKQQLINTIKLVCEQESSYGDKIEACKIKGWLFDKKHGLILLNYVSDSYKEANKFISPLSYEAVGHMVWEWLQTDEAKTVDAKKWDGDYNEDSDVDTELGFRVYVENWGHVGSYQSGVLCAVKPAYLWYGK